MARAVTTNRKITMTVIAWSIGFLIFFPILWTILTSFKTEAEAIALANDTPYGLAAGIWTDKGSKIFEIASRLKAGVVWLNTYNKFDPASPFGGFKQSGFGREGGMHGLRAYVRL